MLKPTNRLESSVWHLGSDGATLPDVAMVAKWTLECTFIEATTSPSRKGHHHCHVSLGVVENCVKYT